MKLLSALREVKDNRSNRGKTYPLYALLALLICGRLCGYSDVASIWRMSQSLTWRQRVRLGFKRGTLPSRDTLLAALRCADHTSLEQQLARISGGFGKQLCIDGKSLRGRQLDSGGIYHIVSLFCHQIKAVYGQCLSSRGGVEVTSALELLSSVDLSGRVITGDAMFTQHRLCKLVTDRGGDYVLPVKENSSSLLHDVKQVFRLNPWPESVDRYSEPMVKAHGRIEQRSIELLPWLSVPQHNGYDTINQVARITRKRQLVGRDMEVTHQYIITSLSSAQASAKELLAYNRNHWSIENNLHRNRDTLYSEDVQTVRKGRAPINHAALSNLALHLLDKKKKQTQHNLRALTQHYARNLRYAVDSIAPT